MTDPREHDLEEVERALSVLDGRHPEKVRAERLAAEALAKRQKEHEAAAIASRRATWKRGAIMLGALLVCAVAGFFVWRFFAARRAADEEMAPLVFRYVSRGFDALPRGATAPQERVELTTVAGDCYAFVASHGAQMRIDRPVGTAGAPGAALMCTCASESVTVSAPGAVVRALHIAGRALGGTRQGLSRFSDAPPIAIAGDEACADDMFAAYAREKQPPAQEVDAAWTSAHRAFDEAGFTALAVAPARSTFGFAPRATARCWVAASTSNDALTLWVIDPATATKLIQHATNAMAWCAEKEATFVVEDASARGTIIVASAPAARVGGMLGLREIARADGLAITPFARDEERGALAVDTLRASVVPEPVATGCESIDANQTQTARVLVFSNATADTFSTSDLDYRCAPALGEPESLCVQARALAWRAPPPSGDKSAVCAAAYGPLPYWMSAIADSPPNVPGVIDVELTLLTLARKLAARGFSPTVIEGVTERVDSVEILGRSGDDAIVAVGLSPAPPFARPYTDGPDWALDGEPHVISVKRGERVSLPVTNATTPPSKRRTVVFRHSASQAIH